MTKTEEMSIRIHDAIHSGAGGVAPLEGMVEQPIVTRENLRTVALPGREGLTEWQEQCTDLTGPHVMRQGRRLSGGFLVTMACGGHQITRIIVAGNLRSAGVINGEFTQDVIKRAAEIVRENQQKSVR